MSNTVKIYILAIVSFLVGTSEYIISGILDNISESLGITIAAAGQLITIFSLVYAIFTPVLMALTSGMNKRKLMLFSLSVFILGNILAFVLLGIHYLLCQELLWLLERGWS